jgi:transcriptional regulator with XRE-family HTH domain
MKHIPHFRADRFKQARQCVGLTQLELADRIGAAYQTVCGWEQGHRAPHSISLVRAADVLNVSVKYLLNMEEKP